MTGYVVLRYFGICEWGDSQGVDSSPLQEDFTRS